MMTATPRHRGHQQQAADRQARKAAGRAVMCCCALWSRPTRVSGGYDSVCGHCVVLLLVTAGCKGSSRNPCCYTGQASVSQQRRSSVLPNPNSASQCTSASAAASSRSLVLAETTAGA